MKYNSEILIRNFKLSKLFNVELDSSVQYIFDKIDNYFKDMYNYKMFDKENNMYLHAIGDGNANIILSETPSGSNSFFMCHIFSIDFWSYMEDIIDDLELEKLLVYYISYKFKLDIKDGTIPIVMKHFLLRKNIIYEI